MKKVELYTSESDLLTSIKFIGINPNEIIEFRIYLQSLTENLEYSSTEHKLPWYDLKKGLVYFIKKLKSQEYIIEFDAFTEQLLRKFIQDKDNYNNRLPQLSINSEDDVINTLNNSGFNRNLKSFQLRDVLKLIKLNHGANFSVPGAGKTTTLLAIYSILKQLGRVTNLLVICPINAFISWENELKKIFPDNSVSTLRIKKGHLSYYQSLKSDLQEVLLINYEKLRNDISPLIRLFNEHKFHLVIDESHRIKSGMLNLAYPNIKILSELSVRNDIMSGTPMPQNYTDLIPQFDIIWGNQNSIQYIIDHSLGEDSISKEISSKIGPYFVRTKKQELDIPDPKIIYKAIELGPFQSELYKLLKSEEARKLSGMNIEKIRDFRALGRSAIRMLQVSTNPMLITTNEYYENPLEDIPEESPIWDLLNDFSKYEKPSKLKYLEERVKFLISSELQNKVLIWTYFVKNINLLEKIFKEYSPVSIYGGIQTGSEEEYDTREERIKRFHQDDKCKIMIANPQACGEGISLHEVCHYAIYLDRSFNAAHYLQSVDRIHRLGLPKDIDTTIEILIANHTIDEKLISRLNVKIENMGNILDDEYLRTLAYDPADIAEIDDLGIDKEDAKLILSHITED